MRINPTLNDSLRTLFPLLCFVLAAPQAVFGADPPSITTTHRSGNRVESAVVGGPPPNQGFTGEVTRISPRGGDTILEVRTPFGSVREIVCGPRTQIMRAGHVALISEAKLGDTAGVRLFQSTDRALSVTFTPRAVTVKETPEQIAKKKADGEAKTLKYYQDLADKGDANGQYRLGMKYIKGEGVTKDSALGRSLLEKSAAQGNEDAKAELAKLATSSNSSAQPAATPANAVSEPKKD